jgi:hypothetical protein
LTDSILYGKILLEKGESDMRLKVLALFLISQIPFQASALSFKQVGYIPFGVSSIYGYIKGLDTNHDGFQDLVFTAKIVPMQNGHIVFYGYRPFNRYVFEDSVGPTSLFWDIGDLDGDSLMDVVAQGTDTYPTTVRVFEPSNYWTFPKIKVWDWQYEWIGNGVQCMYITDLDRDGLKEILTADAQVVYVFENRGNNQYVKVYSDTVKSNLPTPPLCFGDFDGDGLMEFAFGTYGGAPLRPTVFVYECTGPDQYQMTWNDTIYGGNMKDVISCPDLDADGKLEFLIGDHHRSSTSWTSGLWIYESTSNNQYEVIFTDSITGTSDRGGYAPHSDCGDVDRDGRPELVWAIDRDWMVYKSPGNNQFQRVFSAYGDNGHLTTCIHIHDMNGNGYPEIIESGGNDISTTNETHIWEVEAAQVVYPNGGETLYGDSLAVIRWRNVDPFHADSFSLFYSADSGLTYSPVARGIAGNDSAYTWTVPKTFSDDCFVMLWAYQNATGWDFSDAPFRIRPGTGVEVPPHASRLTPHVPLSVSPNPFVSYAKAPGYEGERFALYDISGRKVGNYKGNQIGMDLSAGIYFLKPEGKDAKPLRIVKLR